VSGLISKPKRICFCHLEEKQSNKSARQQPFYIAEVYNYNISAGTSFDFGDKKVNYFGGFNSMINFEFKYDAQKRL
jgi:alpha-amylase